MEDLLKESVLENLFESNKEEFEWYIMKMDKECSENQELTAKLEEQIRNAIKELISNEEKKKEILNKFKEFDTNMSLATQYWGRNYYKLGFFNGINFKRELKLYEQNSNKENNNDNFFYKYTDDLMDYIEENRINSLMQRQDYAEKNKNIEEIKNDFPKIRDYLEEGEIKRLNKKELKALLDIIGFNNDIDAMETVETFKLGLKEGKLL